MQRIYLDYAAAAPLDPEVKKVIETEMKTNFDFKNHVFNFIDS